MTSYISTNLEPNIFLLVGLVQAFRNNILVDHNIVAMLFILRTCNIFLFANLSHVPVTVRVILYQLDSYLRNYVYKEL